MATILILALLFLCACPAGQENGQSAEDTAHTGNGDPEATAGEMPEGVDPETGMSEGTMKAPDDLEGLSPVERAKKLAENPDLFVPEIDQIELPKGWPNDIREFPAAFDIKVGERNLQGKDSIFLDFNCEGSTYDVFGWYSRWAILDSYSGAEFTVTADRMSGTMTEEGSYVVFDVQVVEELTLVKIDTVLLSPERMIDGLHYSVSGHNELDSRFPENVIPLYPDAETSLLSYEVEGEASASMTYMVAEERRPLALFYDNRYTSMLMKKQGPSRDFSGDMIYDNSKRNVTVSITETGESSEGKPVQEVTITTKLKRGEESDAADSSDSEG